jgi:iron complex outermembrane receptor protein
VTTAFRAALSIGAASSALALPALATPALAAVPAPAAIGPVAMPAQGDAASIGDIVVTARRRSESLQSVPLSITALSAEALEQRGIGSVQDLAKNAPSVSLGVTTGRKSAPLVGIRGQRAGDVYMTVDPAVGVYLAEVPLARSYGLGVLGLLDIESVQVVKGPQGTLFGRNTTGGAILIQPTAPKDDFEGSARIGTGNYGRIGGELVINIPLSETLSFRGAVAREYRRGYLKSLSGYPAAYSDDYWVYRAALKYEAGDFSSTFYLDGVETNDTGGAAVPLAVRPGSFAARLAGPQGQSYASDLVAHNAAGFWTFASGQPTYSRVHVLGTSNTSTLRLSDHLTLKNIVGYREYRSDSQSDTDGTSTDVIVTQQNARGHQISEELQAQYTSDLIDLTAGGFYFREAGNDSSTAAQARGILPGLFHIDADAVNRSTSAFGQASVKPVEGLSITLGIRQTHDFRGMTSRLRNLTTGCLMTDVGGAPLNPCSRTVATTFDATTWNIGVDYKIAPHHLLYATTRKGYRSGGFNLAAQVPAQFAPFEPERVRDYEIGYKGDFHVGGMAVRLDLAGYISDFTNVQRRISQCNPFITTSCQLISIIGNAASAKIKGLEAEATLRPVAHLDLTGFYALTDAKYDRWDSAGAGGVIQDLSANRFGGLPRHKGGVTARYEIPLGGDAGTLALQGSAYLQSGMYLSDINDPGLYQKAYHLIDTRAEWQDVMGRPVTLSVGVKNLFNKRYFTFGENQYASAFGWNSGYVGEPRMINIDARVRF